MSEDLTQRILDWGAAAEHERIKHGFEWVAHDGSNGAVTAQKSDGTRYELKPDGTWQELRPWLN